MARPRKFDEERVLAAVRDEFWKNGYEATSLDDLMRATGLGKGSLYGAFGDKHQLFLAVLSRYADERVRDVYVALSSDSAAIEKLRRLFRSSPESDESQEAYRGCFLANSATELAPHDCDVLDVSRRTYRAVADLLVETVKQAQEDGDLPDTLNPGALGRMLLAILQGAEFLQKSGMPAGEIDSINDAAERLLLAGAHGQ